MDIPNDLNKLLAQLKQVTRDASQDPNRIRETWASSGSRPGPAEVDLFLRQHDFKPDAAIEQIEITNNGVFECYMFSVCGSSGGLSLLAMRPEQSVPLDEGKPFQSGE
jgi:hypothetical protein